MVDGYFGVHHAGILPKPGQKPPVVKILLLQTCLAMARQYATGAVSNFKMLTSPGCYLSALFVAFLGEIHDDAYPGSHSIWFQGSGRAHCAAAAAAPPLLDGRRRAKVCRSMT
jgi:hypothetical protein